jgi:hypothetical protein
MECEEYEDTEGYMHGVRSMRIHGDTSMERGV